MRNTLRATVLLDLKAKVSAELLKLLEETITKRSERSVTIGHASGAL